MACRLIIFDSMIIVNHCCWCRQLIEISLGNCFIITADAFFTDTNTSHTVFNAPTFLAMIAKRIAYMKRQFDMP